MAVHDHVDHHQQPGKKSLFSRWGFVLLGFLIIAGALLFTEHRAHVLGVLIWLPLLACPLMHLFMHRGHGHGGHGARSTPRDGERQ
jgi:hypothetical protein